MVGINQGPENLLFRIERKLEIDPISLYLKSKPPKPGQTIFIPTGPRGGVKYKEPYLDEQKVYKTGRSANEYIDELFSDEFETGEIRLSKRIYEVKRKKDLSKVIAGGINNAFASGKTILDLGSGRASALLKFSLDYPETIFIGIDYRYKYKKEEEPVVNIHKKGTQLIRDEIHSLIKIPDHSIDTFLSCYGAFTDGVSKDFPEDSLKLITTLNRVAKPGAILRYNTERRYLSFDYADYEWTVNFLRKNGWEVYPTDGNANVAIKKN